MEKKDNTYEPGQETESNLEKLPKTKFEQIDVDTETELVYSFMNDNGWKHVFDSKYPELRVIQNAGKNKDECMTGYRKFIEEIHAKDREKMIHAQEQMGQEWGKIESVFFEVLSEHFETGWPEDKKEIVGYISMLPVFPRFLDKYSFCIGYKDLQSMVETSAHEILHFLWFKKWKETFSEIPRKEYESPHLVWRLSEIMDPIILQCHPKIKELIKPKKWGYSSFKEIKIGDVGMTEYFKDVYLKSVQSADSFEITLRKLWEEAKKNENEISRF